MDLSSALQLACLVPSAAGSLYALLCVATGWRLVRSSPPSARFAGGWPAVSVLKPVCGLEHELEPNLRSACLQDYEGDFEVVYSVQSESDPALPILRGLEREFGPERVRVAVDPARVGRERQGRQPGGRARARAPRRPRDQRQRRAPAPRLPARDRRAARRSRGRLRVHVLPRARGAQPVGAARAADGERRAPAELHVRGRDGRGEPVSRRLDGAAAQDARGDRRHRVARGLPGRGLRDGPCGSARAGNAARCCPTSSTPRSTWPRPRAAGSTCSTGSRTTARRIRPGRPRSRWCARCRSRSSTRSCAGSTRRGSRCSARCSRCVSRAAALFMATVSADRDGLRALWLLPLRDLAGLASWAVALFARRTTWRDGRVRPVGGGKLARRTPPARTVAFTGDDFGFAPELNEAIERAHREGVLGRASLMVGAPAAADAVLRARRNPSCGSGYTWWSVRRARPHLLRGALSRSSSGRRRGAGSPRRFARSSRRSRRPGSPLDHADGHQHMHLHPTVSRLVARDRTRVRPAGACACRASPGAARRAPPAAARCRERSRSSSSGPGWRCCSGGSGARACARTTGCSVSTTRVT